MTEGTGLSATTTRASADVYPPVLCRWQLLVVVMIVTQLALMLFILGRGAWSGWEWFAFTTVYAQLVALSCTSAVCLLRPWLLRLTPLAAWMGSWLVMMLVALPISYGIAVVSTVMGIGPGAMETPSFITTTLLSVALVAAAVLRYLYVHEQWRLEVLAQAEARVQALQARIRPHFLFNCLNTIASLVPVDPDNAERATEDLADLFRGSMRRADEPMRLEQELDLARKFLDMEQRRLGDRLAVTWNVDELPADALILPLILQPLLENAIVHGIQPNPLPGRIDVFGRARGGDIMITISNSLAPVTQGAQAETTTAGNGIALANVRERLKLAFEERATLLTRREDTMHYAVLSFPHVENTDR